MLALLYPKRLRLPSQLALNPKYVENSTTHLTSLLCNAPFILLRPFSFIKLANDRKKDDEEQKKITFTVSYLKNSCGLPHQSAVYASKYVKFMSPEKPDAVIRVLRDYGFDDTHVSRLVKKLPSVLLAKPEKTLLPKLEFLHSIGVSSSELPDIICWNPNFLSRSLQKHIIPCYNALKKYIDDDKKVLKVFRLSSWIFLHNVRKNIAANALILKEHGVPPSIISQLLVSYPATMTLNAVKFSESVKKIIELEFNPSSSTFVHGLQALSQMSKSTWEHKMKVYRSLGWSDDEFWLAFRRHPICVKSSEKKILTVVDFLVKKMGWQPSDVARVPTILCYSMEKRIIPRCSVIKILLSKGLVEEEIHLASVLTSTEKYFLHKFVTKHLDRVPYLLSIFQGKTSLQELGLGFDQ